MRLQRTRKTTGSSRKPNARERRRQLRAEMRGWILWRSLQEKGWYDAQLAESRNLMERLVIRPMMEEAGMLGAAIDWEIPMITPPPELPEGFSMERLYASLGVPERVFRGLAPAESKT